MKRCGSILLALSALTMFASAVKAQERGDANQASQGSTFGFDTPTSPRPRSSLSYKAAATQGESSYSYSIPNYVPNKISARVRLAASAPYYYPLPAVIGPSYTGEDFAWGNAGTWVGHLQYNGYGYPFASPVMFGFGR
jgi:hypothetical protein